MVAILAPLYNTIILLIDKKKNDHVNWEFLIVVMEKMSFWAKWVRWMRWCISFACVSILINETSASFFASSKGLR